MNSRKELVLATRNPGKKEEIEALIHDLGLNVTYLPDYAHLPPVEEDRPTLEGNAEKKARAVFDALGIPALADDTGLEVSALNGRPGVHSARYAGEEARADQNRRLLLEELKGTQHRDARFRTVLAYVDGENEPRFFEGICRGVITEEERGRGGFGYDPVFLPEGSDLTFAELSREAKNGISHRGKALRMFVDYLERSYDR